MLYNHLMFFKYKTIEDMLAVAQEKNELPFLLILDSLEDPRNFGAILRTAEAAGVHGVIIPKRRAVDVTETVIKTSTGAANLIPIAQVPNLVNTIKELKEQNIWIVGIEANSPENYSEIDYTSGIGLVIGGEDKGISRLIKENCDHLANIPMKGEITSLNASVAAALVMFEVVRQR